MRIAHWSLFAPGRSGMYHTTRDLIEAQRAAGIECAMIDAFRPGCALRDGEFVTATSRFADTADIYCLHSKVPPPFFADGTPTVFVLHGHPLYSWQSELYGLEPGNPFPWSTSLRYFRDERVQRLVTFWPEQKSYWEILDGPRAQERVRLVPRGIRFAERWRPEGERAELPGRPALVIADQFRLLKDSFALWFAVALFARRCPQARLHLYVIPEANSTQGRIIRDAIEHSELVRIIGSVNGVEPRIERVYRAADIVLSSVRGESRVALEAMACGADVVAQSCALATEADFRSPETIAEAIEKTWRARIVEGPARRERLHRQVVEAFAIERTVAGMRAVYEELI